MNQPPCGGWKNIYNGDTQTEKGSYYYEEAIMEKNSILSDFIVLNRQRIDELEANLWQMEHKKSGFWLARKVTRFLFPDTCYRFAAGGDPEPIPELTYETFAAAVSAARCFPPCRMTWHPWQTLCKSRRRGGASASLAPASRWTPAPGGWTI